MTNPVVLSEYEDVTLSLSEGDAAFLASSFGDRITVRRSFQGDAYVLNPRQHVGLLSLPSGLRLECRPKVPARNLFVMVAAAFDLPDPFIDAPADLHVMEGVLDVVVHRFARLVEELLDRGLYRAYVEEEDNLAVVRGRIAMVEDLRRNSVLRQRTYCRYTDYSWDVPENRVIRQVVRFLLGWGLRSDLIWRLRRLDALLEDVTPGQFIARDLERFGYHRLNEEYRPIHRLCQLFLEGLSPSEASGVMPFNAFLLDMNRLFEAYVTRSLQDQARGGLVVEAQRVIHLDHAHEVAMRPDLSARWHGQPRLIADCKYKRLTSDRHSLSDLYQVIAYCTALNVQHGLLIYPRHLTQVTGTVSIRGRNMKIYRTTIDLNVQAEEMANEIQALAQQVHQFAQGAPVAPLCEPTHLETA